MIIAFDCDGTLLNLDGSPNYRVIDLLMWCWRNGDRILVWSGGGKGYAQHVCRKLGFPETWAESKNITTAALLGVDICCDDENVQLGAVNIKIAPRQGAFVSKL